MCRNTWINRRPRNDWNLAERDQKLTTLKESHKKLTRHFFNLRSPRSADCVQMRECCMINLRLGNGGNSVEHDQNESVLGVSSRICTAICRNSNCDGRTNKRTSQYLCPHNPAGGGKNEYPTSMSTTIVATNKLWSVSWCLGVHDRCTACLIWRFRSPCWSSYGWIRYRLPWR